MGAIVAMVAPGIRQHVLEGFVTTVREAGYLPALVTTQDVLDNARYDVRSLVPVIGVAADLTQPELIAKCARRIAGDDLAALLSWSDSTITATAYAAELLGVAKAPADGLACSRNKHAMRVTLRSAGLPSPTFALLGHEDEVDRIADQVGFPAMIKPVNGSGSVLVRKVRSAEELRRTYRALRASAPHVAGGSLNRPAWAPGGSSLDPTSQFLVERVLTGPEYDAEIAVRDGVVSVTLIYRVLAQDETFFGFGYAYPPLGLSPERENLVVAAFEQAILAMGIDNTTVNATLIDDVELGPTIVELNAGRFGGQMVWRLVLDLTGVDVQAQNLALQLGERSAEPQAVPADVSFAALTVFAKEPGVVVAVHGLEELRAHPNVAYVSTFVEPGDVVLGDEVVYAVNAMVLGFETYQELVALHRQLDRIVHVETRALDRAAVT